MDKKLIAVDVDGTLLQTGETAIRKEFFREARRLMARGVHFCAASGRQYSSLRRLFAPIADSICYICENGAVIFGDGELLAKSVIPRQQALELCHDILAQPDCEVLISGTDMSYLCAPTQEYFLHIQNNVGNNTTVIMTPEEMPEDFVKISAYCKDGAAAVAPRMAPRWSREYQMAVAGEQWLDFNRFNKGDGLQVLCAELDIPPESVAAFGDNYNDVAMLDLAGAAYLADSAAPELLERYPNHFHRVEDVLMGF